MSHRMLYVDPAQYLQVHPHIHKIGHNGHFILHHKAGNGYVYMDGR